ncbi:iron chelate uptake ABC transporter family permease subunit [Corynebacterium canis]|uniref:Iron chelate uptake ABC transporter family permease subunit n=1 Tax=Corynebacterium canis TaxID=679663 RepID=A0A5C5UGI9_9CORY|nr:iron chelate uptake ABC transporter family permease subunit [Corynebacterium canis]TWT24580.1 iron chelate uptake ABC transporter family permease subunit [Corynebacterium canis]WJY75462.1 Iron-uptake system permease protein FeuC [Corynebacterium canis]
MGSLAQAAARRRTLITWFLIVLALAASALFVLYDLPRAWQFVIERRIITVVGLSVVGIAIGASTVAFQTITANKILTPSLMGFDAMFVLIQTVIVFVFGTVLFNSADSLVLFAINSCLMLGLSLLLFGVVFAGGRMSLDLLLLVGIVVGVLFRSLSSLLARMIDPGEYQVLQDRFFATFSFIDVRLLILSAILIIAVVAAIWARRRTLDVILLGREPAISLGVNYRREVILILVACSLLVSASTALVGPVTFFGLIVANLAYVLVRTDRHAWTIPAASALGMLSLVAGQWILGKVFAFNTSLSVIIEFLGGLLFLYLLLSKKGMSR